MAVILFHYAEPFELNDNTPSTESSVCQAVSEKKTFKHYEILYMYIAQRLGQVTLRGKI